MCFKMSFCYMFHFYVSKTDYLSCMLSKLDKFSAKFLEVILNIFFPDELRNGHLDWPIGLAYVFIELCHH